MYLLGIDYGSKKVGLALADDKVCIATPFKVLKNDRQLLDGIRKIVDEQEVEAIIIGESKDYKGEDNPIMRDINRFKTDLNKIIAVPVYFEQEFLTTRGAEHVQEDIDMTDASAAAIILQSYIDGHKHYE